jgi:hypothetical protein
MTIRLFQKEYRMEHDDMEKMDEDIANAFDPEQNAALIAMIEDENQTPTGSIRITIDWIAD